ncbi:MAG: NfeD family protein [Phycisphaerae bacterium]|nr:NfeD family protein [Phycisphaerae bacterium]
MTVNIFAVEELPAEPAKPLEVQAAVIVCKGMIDDGLYKSIKRRTETALAAGTEYIFYEIQTYGGLVASADDISKFLILDTNKKVDTAAFVTSEAISAGAIISTACKDIIMLENTTIGDAAPITMGAKLEGVEREKTESFVRAMFARAAQANHYPEVLLKAMVSIQVEVWRAKNLKTGEFEFFETKDLPNDPNAYDIAGKELVVKNDELLTLTAAKAHEFGIARAVVQNLDEAIAFLEKRDNVTFTEPPVVLETNWSEEMVRWVSSPTVAGILVMLAMLGVYMELNTPGVGLPGLLAVVCFTILIGSRYLIGLANWLEVVIFAVGIILLLVEVFVLPGFGIAGTLGILCILAGIFGMLIKNPPDKIPWPQTDLDWQVFTNGAMIIFGGFLAFIVLAVVFSKIAPRLEFLSGFSLKPSDTASGGETQKTEIDSLKLNLQKIGDTGQVITTLRPVGRVKFASRIVDAVAEGEFIEKGANVQIVEIHGNRIVVKKNMQG